MKYWITAIIFIFLTIQAYSQDKGSNFKSNELSQPYNPDVNQPSTNTDKNSPKKEQDEKEKEKEKKEQKEKSKTWVDKAWQNRIYMSMDFCVGKYDDERFPNERLWGGLFTAGNCWWISLSSQLVTGWGQLSPRGNISQYVIGIAAETHPVYALRSFFIDPFMAIGGGYCNVYFSKPEDTGNTVNRLIYYYFLGTNIWMPDFWFFEDWGFHLSYWYPFKPVNLLKPIFSGGFVFHW